MFLNHFQMTQHPFAEKPPVEWLLQDDRFQEALARLSFFQNQGHLALVLGQTGVGKSSLLRCFTRSLPLNRCQCLYFSLTIRQPQCAFATDRHRARRSPENRQRPALSSDSGKSQKK